MARARTADPWEQIDGESPKAYEAFVVYRDLGYDRSLSKVASQLSKSLTLMRRWSATHSWVIRSSAWDQEEDRLRVQAMRKQRNLADARNARLGSVMLNKVVDGLQSIDVTKMSAGDIARLAEAASKLERVAFDSQLGAPGSRSAGLVDDETTFDADAMTDEERRARMQMVHAELGARIADGGSLDWSPESEWGDDEVDEPEETR